VTTAALGSHGHTAKDRDRDRDRDRDSEEGKGKRGGREDGAGLRTSCERWSA
jgi:hypothetical protein